MEDYILQRQHRTACKRKLQNARSSQHFKHIGYNTSKDIIWLTLLGGTRILLRGIRVGSTETPFRCSTPGFNG
eukprot:scaffold250060_cov32-Attheya_sp.AAC.1